jgi:hypothetical protein
MATLFTDNFNSYNDGNLNGQGGWYEPQTADSPQIQGTVVKEGAKAVKIEGTTYQRSVKTGIQLADGRLTFYWRRNTNSSGTAYFSISKDGDWKAQEVQLYMTNNGRIALNTSGGLVYLGNYNANQWYCLEIEWRSSDHKFRVRIDGGIWSNWYAFSGNWSYLDKVRLSADNGAASDVTYYDYIAEYPIGVGRSHGYIF